MVDFLPTGEGPLVQALDRDEPESDKPDLTGEGGKSTAVPTSSPPPTPSLPPIKAPPPPTPNSPSNKGPSPQTAAPSVRQPKKDPKDDVVVPSEVVALFDQFGVDVSSMPPELTLLAYKVVSSEQITDEELKRARYSKNMVLLPMMQ